MTKQSYIIENNSVEARDRHDAGKRRRRLGVRKPGKCLRETTGDSETWNIGITQPQIASQIEGMYKHTV